MTKVERYLDFSRKINQPKWQRVTLLIVLAYEGIGGVLGGILLSVAPDGHLMDMSTKIMHGFFPDFLIPGLILTGLGVLNLLSFIAVIRNTKAGWLFANTAMIGFTIWFVVEIAILRELHWLHIMWGVPVLVGDLMAFPLIPWRRG